MTDLREGVRAVLEQLAARAAGDASFGPARVNELVVSVVPAVIQSASTHTARGGSGMGDPAEVPWVQLSKGSAQRGFYVVYLFAADGTAVYLSLNQATDNVRGGATVLQKRALDLRNAVGTASERLVNEIDLRSRVQRPRRYEAGNALAVRYKADDLPTSDVLFADIDEMIELCNRAIAAGLVFDAVIEPMHLLFKWDPDQESRTIELHRDVAERQGSVWWGRFAGPSAPGVSDAKVETIADQLRRGVPTYAFLYRRGELWRTTVEAVTTDRTLVDRDRLPTYYGPERCNFFVRVSSFVSLEPGWVGSNLYLASKPDRDPSVLAGALSNQTTPVYVFQSGERRPLVSTASTPPALLIEPLVDLSMNWLVEETGWSEDLLEEVCGSLREGLGQVVLVGPPGTGKTFVAERIAKFITNDAPLARKVVQFHPSYGYEEFVEGLRPVARGGEISFERQDGHVLQMVTQMQTRDEWHAMILDEMNRANLPRVLGELMYAFEYRDKPVDLMYTESFELPRKLVFIGTMNSVDRNVRSMDLALRRRFDFYECPPLPRVLEAHYRDRVCEVGGLGGGFQSLNEQLIADLDRHHAIGHSFLIAEKMTRSVLRHRWIRQIYPILEEYFADEPDMLAGYTFERFWPALD